MSFSQKSTLLIFIILNKKLIGKLVGYFVCVFFLIQYLSWAGASNLAEPSLNGAGTLTQHKNKDIKTLKPDN